MPEDVHNVTLGIFKDKDSLSASDVHVPLSVINDFVDNLNDRIRIISFNPNNTLNGNAPYMLNSKRLAAAEHVDPEYTAGVIMHARVSESDDGLTHFIRAKVRPSGPFANALKDTINSKKFDFGIRAVRDVDGDVNRLISWDLVDKPVIPKGLK